MLNFASLTAYHCEEAVGIRQVQSDFRYFIKILKSINYERF